MFEILEEKLDAREGARAGEVSGLEGGLFCDEGGARDRELGPGVKYFGGL